MIQAKKYLGQHFLKNLSFSKRIVDSLFLENTKAIVEIGPGMGALTQFLLKKNQRLFLVEIDPESINYLKNHYDLKQVQLIQEDFLKWDPATQDLDNFALIGNFPYNISSQIIFRLLELKDLIPQCVGMFQREVAQRLSAKEGNKIYGKTSVLLQAFYEVEYLFEITKENFSPAPQVISAVLRMNRKKTFLECDEKLFFRLVKAAFGQRRKTLRNALKSLDLKPEFYKLSILDKRAEALSVKDFVELTKVAMKAL